MDVVFEKATGLLDCDADSNTFLDVSCGGNNTSDPVTTYASSTVGITSTASATSTTISVDTYGIITY